MATGCAFGFGGGLAILAVSASLSFAADATSFDRTVQPLLTKHCVECHGGEKPAGGVRLDQPAPDLADAKVRAMWEKAHAVLVRGEMPPEENPRLSTDDLDTLTSWIRREVERAVIADRGGAGRSTMRRLTRVEYARLIEDVLDLRFANVPLSLVEKLPIDPQTDLPINDGDRLAFQSLHWRSYADYAERAVSAVLASAPRPEPWSYRFDAPSLESQTKKKDRFEGLRGVVAANENEIKRPAKATILGIKDGREALNPDGSTTLLPSCRLLDNLARSEQNDGSWYLLLPYVEPKGVLRLRIRAGAIIPEGENVPLMRVAFHHNVRNEFDNRLLAEIPVTNPAHELRDYEVEVPMELVPFAYTLFERLKFMGVRISNDTVRIARSRRSRRRASLWNGPIRSRRSSSPRSRRSGRGRGNGRRAGIGN